MSVEVIKCLNPVPQGGGPRELWTLWDPEHKWHISRTGKPVSGHGAPLFDTQVGAQLCADEINGPRITEDWDEGA